MQGEVAHHRDRVYSRFDFPNVSLISTQPGSFRQYIGIHIGPYIRSIENKSSRFPMTLFIGGTESPVVLPPGGREELDLCTYLAGFSAFSMVIDVPLTEMKRSEAIDKCRAQLDRALAPSRNRFSPIWNQRATDFLSEVGAILEEAESAEYTEACQIGDWFNYPPAVLTPFENNSGGEPICGNVFMVDWSAAHRFAITETETKCGPSYTATPEQRAERERINSAPRISISALRTRWQAKYREWMEQDKREWIERVFPQNGPETYYFPVFDAQEHACEVDYLPVLSEGLLDSLTERYHDRGELWRGFGVYSGGFMAIRSP